MVILLQWWGLIRDVMVSDGPQQCRSHRSVVSSLTVPNDSVDERLSSVWGLRSAAKSSGDQCSESGESGRSLGVTTMQQTLALPCDFAEQKVCSGVSVGHSAHSKHRFLAPSPKFVRIYYTTRGTLYLHPCSCPLTRTVPSERFQY